MKASFLSALSLLTMLTTSSRGDLIGYWDVNTAVNNMSAGTVFTADQGAGTLTLTSNPNAGGFDAFGGTGVNLLAPSSNGQAIRVTGGENSNGAVMTIAVDTTNLQNIVLSFALDINSGSGHDDNQIAYSSNGGLDFTNFGSTFPGGTQVYTLETFDFTPITALNNNPNTQFRITIGGGSGSNNSRDSQWDNFQVNGTAIPEPTSLALAAIAIGSVLISLKRKS